MRANQNNKNSLVSLKNENFIKVETIIKNHNSKRNKKIKTKVTLT